MPDGKTPIIFNETIHKDFYENKQNTYYDTNESYAALLWRKPSKNE
jgi:hypothetical protein